MDINTVIVFIMLAFIILAALDKIFGNKFGLGTKFDEGFHSLGPLAIAMLGIISIAPVLSKILQPIVGPVYAFLGADPAMFAGTLLANDMGGYHLAIQLAQTTEAGIFSGLILGSMMGATIVFTIPVAISIIKKRDYSFLAQGILIGIMTLPLGAFVGGLIAGFPVGMVFFNLIPVIIFSLLIALGLWKIPNKMITGFKIFGRAIMILITIATVLIVFETLTGIVILPGMTPLSEGFIIIGSIAIILIGAFPMVYVITKYLKKPLTKLGKYLGMDANSIAGMIATLANNIPMFVMLKDMNNRGKIINIAFAVSAAFILGDHLGFTAGVNQNLIFPVMVGKIVGGISAVAIAFWFTRNMKGSSKA